MIRQDYIMRMIEQLTKVLSKITFTKQSENYQAAIDIIENAFQNILGLDYNLLNSLSAKDIISFLKISNDKTKRSVSSIIIAKLFKEKANIIELIDEENKSSVFYYQKALSLYLEGILNSENIDLDLSKYFADVRNIVSRLNEKKFSEDTRMKLLKFYSLKL